MHRRVHWAAAFLRNWLCHHRRLRSTFRIHIQHRPTRWREFATNTYLDDCSIGQVLRRLVELRVSQMNGCTYCIWPHGRQLSDPGEAETRIAALEAVTEIATKAPSDSLYEALRGHFEDRQIVELTAIVANMNALNRMAISFQHEAPEPP